MKNLNNYELKDINGGGVAWEWFGKAVATVVNTIESIAESYQEYREIPYSGYTECKVG